MVESDFANLSLHLESVRPLVEEFCQRRGFERIEGPSVGRYPRIRLQRTGEIILWIDLWMGLDSAGHRFSQFFPSIPYELSAGAYFDEPSGHREKFRFQKSFLIWTAKPFTEVPANLNSALEEALVEIEKWDLSFLREQGLRVRLG